MAFFKNNSVIKKERQKTLSNHFALTQPDEEQSSINLAKIGVVICKVIMFGSFVSIGFVLPFDGLRQIITIATALTLGFFVIKFKGIFTERLLVALLNLMDEELPEAAHIKANQQYVENKNKTIALWAFAVIVVAFSGYFAAKLYVSMSVTEMTESKEKKNNYNAAAYNYNEAVKEGKSSVTLKELANEMKRSEKALSSDRETVKSTNIAAHKDAHSDLYVYAFLAVAFELLISLCLFQLMKYIETKQHEEFLAERAKNGGVVVFDGNTPKNEVSINEVLEQVKNLSEKLTSNNKTILDRFIVLQDKVTETNKSVNAVKQGLTELETKTRNSFKELETETKKSVSDIKKQVAIKNDLLNGYEPTTNNSSVPKL